MSRSPLPETPRVEPEIIPPDRSGRASSHGGLRWDSINPQGAHHRVYVTRLGPFSIFGFVLVFGFVVAAVLALLVGAVLVALPVIAVLIAVAVVANILRPRLRHSRW